MKRRNIHIITVKEKQRRDRYDYTRVFAIFNRTFDETNHSTTSYRNKCFGKLYRKKSFAGMVWIISVIIEVMVQG